MFGSARGSTRTILLVVLAVVMVCAIVYYVHRGATAGEDVRAYHCNACGKDFKADVNKLGNTKPACPSCSSKEVTTVPKKQ